MDYDIEKAVMEAWGRVEPVLARDAGELAMRRARRRMGVMLRPPRAWCLGVRANDTRMTAERFEMRPDEPAAWDVWKHRWVYREHTVRLQSAQLRWMCRPVTVPWPGVMAKELAKMLGVNEATVVRAIRRGGVFRTVRYIKGLAGNRGHLAPVVYTERLLDPAGIPMGRMADAMWGTMAWWVSDHVPDGIDQTLVRRTHFHPFRGEMRFRGWRWVCPGCGREATHVYYPLPALMRAEFVASGDDGSVDAVVDPPGCFACKKCHGMTDMSLVNGQGWNQFIAHVSGGLLYGKEVRKPEGLAVVRKRAHRPHRHRGTSKRQKQITGFLVDTEMSCSQIAKRLGLAMGTVCGWVWRIYQRNGVHSRAELRRKMGVASGGMQAAG